MIVTKDALLAVGGCPIIVQHLEDSGYTGLSRLQFVQKLQQDAGLDIHPQWWVNWAKVYLYSGDAIVQLCEFVKTNRYRVEGMNITDTDTIFLNQQEAIDTIQQKQAEQIATEEWMFHVQAQCPEGADVHTLENCDLDGDGVFDHPVNCYQVFNPTTGQYEYFDTFEPAKLRCDELRRERFSLICASYRLLEEVREINNPEENPLGWTRCDVGEALDYKG